MDENEKQIIDRNIDFLFQATINYWIALLTANTIIIAVFSALSVFSNYDNLLISVLIIFAMLSSFLLIYNFRLVKNIYYSIGLISQGIITDNGTIKKIHNKAIQYHDKNKRQTILSEIILGIETVLIIFLII